MRQLWALAELMWCLADAAIENVINTMERACMKEEVDALLKVDAQDGAKSDREETSEAADVAITDYAPPKRTNHRSFPKITTHHP